MIFVTVGSDIPFDRLIRTVDRWAGANHRCDVFAQIGKGGWKPEHIPCQELLEPAEFRNRLLDADFIVAHAGMGTILSSLQHSKPILVMPRKGVLGETRNEHQMATARRLMDQGRVHVAFDEEQLLASMDRLEQMTSKETISPFASESLISNLRNYIHQCH